MGLGDRHASESDSRVRGAPAGERGAAGQAHTSVRTTARARATGTRFGTEWAVRTQRQHSEAEESRAAWGRGPKDRHLDRPGPGEMRRRCVQVLGTLARPPFTAEEERGATHTWSHSRRAAPWCGQPRASEGRQERRSGPRPQHGSGAPARCVGGTEADSETCPTRLPGLTRF